MFEVTLLTAYNIPSQKMLLIKLKIYITCTIYDGQDTQISISTAVKEKK
jgi:hypothetical protein